MKPLKVYVAGKVSKESVFGTHYWRDEFVETLAKLSGRELVNVDPTKTEVDNGDPAAVYGCDAYIISQADALVVYLSDDISVGGSQEILIAKYFKKPVIGLAPIGGKFNGRTKEYFGRTIKNHRDPFVFSSCDVVYPDIAGVADVLKKLEAIEPKSIDFIGELADRFRNERLATNEYLQKLLGRQ